MATTILIILSLIQPAQTEKPLYGAVFVCQSPTEATHSIFIEDDQLHATLKVFKVSSKVFADKTGLWFITDNRAESDHTVYFTNSRLEADLTIFYVDSESFAGLN